MKIQNKWYPVELMYLCTFQFYMFGHFYSHNLKVWQGLAHPIHRFLPIFNMKLSKYYVLFPNLNSKKLHMKISGRFQEGMTSYQCLMSPGRRPQSWIHQGIPRSLVQHWTPTLNCDIVLDQLFMIHEMNKLLR